MAHHVDSPSYGHDVHSLESLAQRILPDKYTDEYRYMIQQIVIAVRIHGRPVAVTLEAQPVPKTHVSIAPCVIISPMQFYYDAYRFYDSMSRFSHHGNDISPLTMETMPLILPKL